MSLNPILFTQVPPLDAIVNKFASLLDTFTLPPNLSKDSVVALLTNKILPYLRALSDFTAGKSKSAPPLAPAILAEWVAATSLLASAAPAAKLFPFIDLWRLALLDQDVATKLGPTSPKQNPVLILVNRVEQDLSNSSVEASVLRGTVLTTLRLLSNGLGAESVARPLFSVPATRDQVIKFLVPCLLHEDASVRTAAASAVFNLAALLQRGRVGRVRAGRSDSVASEFDGDWEVEIVSAVIEAIGREVQSEDVGEYLQSLCLT